MKSYSIYSKRGVYYIQWYDEAGKKNAKSLKTKDGKVAELNAIRFFEGDVKGSTLDYLHIQWDMYAHAVDLATRTRKDSRDAMSAFIDFYQKTEGSPHKSAKDITQDDLYRFLIYLKQDRGFGITTIAIRLRSLKSIFNYSVKRGLIQNKPFAGFKIPKGNSRKYCLEIDEIKRLLWEAQDTILHRAWIEFILLTGCRQARLKT